MCDFSKDTKLSGIHHPSRPVLACLGVPCESVPVGQNARGHRTAIVSTEAHQHQSRTGHLTLRLEVEHLSDGNHPAPLHKGRLQQITAQGGGGGEGVIGR